MKRRWEYSLKLWYHASALFRERHTHAHELSGGPLGPKEMSVCGLIQPPVPGLMMASTCCFNVTAGSPSIPHWLWLPSAAGSSPLHPSPSLSRHLSLHHLPSLPSCVSHINIIPFHQSLCFVFLLLLSCRTKSYITSPLPSLFPFLFVISKTFAFSLASHNPVLFVFRLIHQKKQ